MLYAFEKFSRYISHNKRNFAHWIKDKKEKWQDRRINVKIIKHRIYYIVKYVLYIQMYFKSKYMESMITNIEKAI